MCGLSGVPSASRHDRKSGAGVRLRSRAFPASVLGGLTLLSAWWLPVGAAQATSYPPALGCAVTGTAAAGSAGVQVQGMGFRAGSLVRISAGGQSTRVIADRAGSFEAWLPARVLIASTTLTAAGPGCTARSLVAIGNPPSAPGGSSTPPGRGGTGHPTPTHPGTRPGPVAPSDPGAAAIPVVPLAHLPSQLFLGLAGAVLLTGAALTGLTGRWGYRAESRPSSGASISGTVPVTPDSA